MSKELTYPTHWETSSNFRVDRESKLDRESKIDPFPRHDALETIDEDSDDSDDSNYPNTWAKIRHYISEAAAEFLGTMILIIFGCGVIAQVVLTNHKEINVPRGDWMSINFGWGAGAAIAVWVCAGISGAHINPAVTLALATWRDFPWKKVPIYIAAQMLGAIVGAAIIYGNYWRAIDLVEGGKRTLDTAGIFATYPLPYMSNLGAFFDEFLATAVFVIGVVAALDSANSAPSPGLLPVAVFLLVLAIGTALGGQTGYAINPARDLGPRLVTAMVGYGTQVFTYRSHYWFWCPGIATTLGAQAGIAIYDFLIFTGKESIFNKPNKPPRRANINVRVPHPRARVPASVPLDNIV